MRSYQHIITTIFSALLLCILHSSCKKLIAIPPPVNTITTTQVFNTEAQANGAMAGIYTRMINGDDVSNTNSVGTRVFSAGLVTLMGGLSSDELYNYIGTGDMGYYVANTNNLTIYTGAKTTLIWETAYTAIYGANSVIEGIAASTSPLLRDSVRKALTGEAKFLRAFSYFYLTNFFGDVPLALSVDFNQTAHLPRATQQQVYEQIVADLKAAEQYLPDNYPTINTERVRPNRFAASALLARVYLYLGDYSNAAGAATTLINNTAMYELETGLNNVFLTGSREAIWQLQQTTTDGVLKDATPEGWILQQASLCLTTGALQAFEEGDERLSAWVDSANNNSVPNAPHIVVYYPAKYKIGNANGTADNAPREYYMVIRLAEMYLIRAEAAAHGAPGGTAAAIADLNVIRKRAGLKKLPESLTLTEVIAAVAQERRIEFFGEWGHRWLDLKRTGKAHDALSVIPLKQPWRGDFQLLYPIPPEEINTNHFLTQNAGY